MTFNPMAFIENLYYMGTGMASILIVMAVLILITTVLNKLFSKKFTSYFLRDVIGSRSETT